MKISRLEFVHGYEWLENEETAAKVIEIVIEVVKLFAPDRCMFASNIPDTLPERLGETFVRFFQIAAHFPEGRDDLFFGTAVRAYRLDTVV